MAEPAFVFDGPLGWALWHGLERALQNQDPHLWTGGDGKITTLDEAHEAISSAIHQAEVSQDASRKIFLQLAEKVDVGTATIKDSFSLQGLLFLNSPYRNHWYCAGIGTGKSYLGARYALRRVLTNWETVGLMAANSYKQLTQSTLPHLFALLKDSRLKYVVDKKPPESWGARNIFKNYEDVISIRVAKGKVAHILTRTLENWTAIRGITIGWAVIDEIADTRFEAWEEINERLRCPLSQALQIRVLGMPALPGDNWTWEEFSGGDPTLYRITFQASTEALHLSWEKYLKPLLSRLDPLKALQRIFARIVIDQTGRVYYAYRDGINNVQKEGCAYDPHRPLYLTFDFNILSSSPLSAVVLQLYDNGAGAWDVQVHDEIILPGGNTIQACHEFLKRYGGHRSEVHIYGDASGGHSQTISEYSLISETLGPAFRRRLVMPEITSNPLISERVAAVNGKLRNALGVSTLFINPKCKELILDMRKLVPKVSKTSKDVVEGKIDKSDPERSHASDALGYLLRFLFPPFETGTTRRSIKAHY